MASVAAQLSNHIKRTVIGPMWHGAALDDLLKDVTPEQAAARPIAGAHTIWEIVVHVTAWTEIARARLRGGRTADATGAEDWPPVGPAGAAEWQVALERLRDGHRALATDVRRLDNDAAIDAKVPGLDYTVANLLHGVIEHGTYHGGQIALLARAWRPDWVLIMPIDYRIDTARGIVFTTATGILTDQEALEYKRGRDGDRSSPEGLRYYS